jgi:hypothetical protein
MNFPGTYFRNKKVLISWTYAWGRLEDNTFFHCAHFTEEKDGEPREATHISIHDPRPHYYEILNDGYGKTGNTELYFTDNIRIFVHGVGKQHKHKINKRAHRYLTNVDVKVVKGNKKLTGAGWCGVEESNKHWAGIICDSRAGPYVNNWNWIAIKMDSGLDIMLYDTKTERYCCTVESGTVKKQSDCWLSNNYLEVTDYNLRVTLIPVAVKSIFQPEFGMDYSVQPFIIIGDNSNGYGVRETTYGGVLVDKELIYGG